MTFIERKIYCETMIEPYKEELPDEALAEIRNFYKDYSFNLDPDKVYTNEELKEIEENEEFELWSMIINVLCDNDITYYDPEFDEEMYFLDKDIYFG